MSRLVIAAALVSLQITAWAVEPRLDARTHDLAIEGSPDFLGPSGDTLRIKGGYGWFYRDRLLIRGFVEVATVEDIAAGNNDYRMRELGTSVEYHVFDRGPFVPYVGFDIAYRRSKYSFRDPAAPSELNIAARTTTEGGVSYGPRVGLKYFLADNVAVDVVFNYRVSSNDVFISDQEAESTYFALNFGLRVAL